MAQLCSGKGAGSSSSFGFKETGTKIRVFLLPIKKGYFELKLQTHSGDHQRLPFELHIIKKGILHLL